ncbi:MAG: Gfo/Idh/MocA family protein, partial [Candidatus Kariarchaeaceae archaeon]
MSLKIGIVGADSAGKSWGAIAHVPAIQNLDVVKLEALCNSSPESANAAGKYYGIDRVFYSINDLVNQPDIDIITVVVRIPNHFEMVKAALEAGKHVYCEWPLGATLEETSELAKLAKDKQVVTAIGFQGEHDPSLNYIKLLYENGWFGNILSVQMTHLTRGSLTRPSRKEWVSEVKKGAHLMNIVGGHTINYLQFCFGMIEELTANLSIQMREIQFLDTNETAVSEIVDTILIQGKLSNGAILDFNISSVPYHSEGWTLRVNGSKGTIIAKSDILPQISPIS